MSNAIVERKVQDIRSFLGKNMKSIQASCIEIIKPEYLCRVALTCIMSNEKLLDCSQESLLSSIIKATQSGLSLDSNLGEAYLVPYGGKAQFQTGYQGILKLIYNSGLVKEVVVKEVLAGDVFDFEDGTTSFIKHKKGLDRPEQIESNMEAVYAIIKLNSGGVLQEVMSKKEIDAHMKKFSKGFSRSDSSWKTNYIAMAKKTVLIKVAKFMPKSPKNHALQTVMSIEDKQDNNITSALDYAIDPQLVKSDQIESSPLNELADKPTDILTTAKEVKTGIHITDLMYRRFDECVETSGLSKISVMKKLKDTLGVTSLETIQSKNEFDAICNAICNMASQEETLI